MPDFTLSYDSCMEAARLASSRGDRLGAEQALAAAIAVAGVSGGTDVQRGAALIKLGELKRDAGNLSEAEELFVRALEASEGPGGQDETGLVSALTNLAAVRTARGAPDDAEPLLTRALALSEARLGRDHPDLVVLLNDLSRLYLKRSAFALAEPLLLRLHAIKRVKGEEHPEVATVLASLATVRQALGDHDAAEQLWRRVLAIRERTLAPNHFAIATAIEHLAETCSARGKIAEALRLYHRALSMREMTLGTGHPSLRVSRERIADLQLQGAEEYASDDDAPSTAPTTEWRVPAPIDYAAAEIVAPAPFPMVRTPGPDRRPAATTTPVQQPLQARSAQPAGLVMQQPMVAPSPIAYVQPVAPELEVPTWLEREPIPSGLMTVTRSAQPMSVARPAAATPAPEEDFDDDIDEYEQFGGRMQNFAASLGGLFRQRQTQVVAAGAVAVALLVVAAATASQPRASAGGDASLDRPVPAQQYVAGGATALVDSMGTSNVAPKAAPRGTENEAPPATTPERPRSEPASGDRTPARTSSAPESPPPIRLPSMGDFSRLSGLSTAKLDSAMRSANGSRATIAAPVVRPSFASTDKALGTVDYSESGSKQSPAILIGAVPRIPYPQNLRARGRETGGEVLVEFSVDTLGRPEMTSVNVVHSDHDLLTAAVRKVIPSMRFVPAQNLGKKVNGKVQVPFYFSVTKD
jgi:TonB family protein